MKKFFVILVGIVGLVTGDGVAYSCDEVSARLVAKSYVLTMPLLGRDNEMIPLMQSNRGYFAQGGGAIRCMQSLGTALVQGGLGRSRELSGPSATERFGGSMPEGLSHLPGEVDRSMRNYGSDMVTMGQELIWLANVLPAAAQGDYIPYNTTGTETRRMISQIQPIYQMLCQMDMSVCQMMLGMFREMAPQIEQQIYVFARQLGN
jgi:hypothetical protein